MHYLYEMRLASRTALYCHEYLHKTYAPLRFDLSGRLEDNAIIKEFKQQGISHEERVIKFILGTSLRVKQIAGEGTSPNREIATAKALLRTDIDVILGASIAGACESELRKTLGERCKGDPLRFSRPDVLVNIGMSTSGFPIWAPVDIKSHSASDSKNKSNRVVINKLPTLHPDEGVEVGGRISKEDAYQLAHYATHLRSLGLGSDLSWAGIIGRDGEAIAWAKLTSTVFGVGVKQQNALRAYELDFRAAQLIIETATARNTDADVIVDSIAEIVPGKFGCKGCEFRAICREEVLTFDGGVGHATVLATVTPAKLREKFTDTKSVADLINETNLNDFWFKAQLRAKTWRDKIPRLLDSSEPLTLPAFDIEVDIDLENSLEALREEIDEEPLGRDQVYLYGYGVHDRKKSLDWRTAEFNSFSNYTDTDDGAYEVMLAMWEKLQELISDAHSQGKTIGIFHYSSHERTWWKNFVKRYAGKPGVPTETELEDFIAANMVDLLTYTRKVTFPTSGYSIKDLAPVAGFSWQVDEAAGAMSLIKYKSAVSKSANSAERDDAIEWLRSYNLDDVRATFAVRNYMRGLTL